MSEEPTYLENTRTYYNEKFAHLNRSGSGLNSEELQRWMNINAELLTVLPRFTARPRILDLGCGRGWLSALLSGFGDVTAVDISDESIATAKERFKGIDFYCGDVTDPSLPAKLGQHSFDIIVSSEVIEHVEEQKTYIENIDALLKKEKGALILTTPNGNWKANYFHGERKGWGQAYEFWLTADELKKLLASRFSSVQIRTFNSSWIGQLKSFGRPDELGGRFRIRLLRITGLLPSYRRWLEKKGFGLYLILNASR